MSYWWVNDSGQNTLKGEPAYEASDGSVFRTLFEVEQYTEVYGLSYWEWQDDLGNPPNPDNPIFLSNAFILDCLRTVPTAKTDFDRIFPSLNSAEQTRLTRMLEKAPFAERPIKDPQVKADLISHRFNTSGVRVAGPKGGTRIG